MSYRSIGITTLVAAVTFASNANAASKTYKKPATVPALKVISTTGPSTVLPIPTEAEIAQATKFVRDTCKDDYKPAPLAKRREFGRDLLRQGIDTRDNAAARYVLLVDAASTAAETGDAVTAARAVDELAKSFQIDPTEMKVAKLGEAAKSAFTREAVEGTVACCLAAAETAAVADQFDPAAKLLTIADGVAEHGQRTDLRSTVQERKKELDALRTGSQEFARAQDVLTKTPNDPAASLTAGRFLCLVRGDWDKGLPLLAAGADELLKSLAVKDLENPADAGSRAQVGGGWWDLAAKLTGVTRSQARRRALYWYRQAVTAGLSGVSRKAVEDRLKDVQAERMRDQNLAPGLLTEMYDGLKFDHKRVTRVDPQIAFEWDKKPADAMPADNFSVVWSGFLNIPQPGRYTFVIIANNGASLDLDGTAVFNQDNMARKRNGERLTVSLDEGLHPFRLRFWDTTGLARIRLLWIPPNGTSSEEVVPPDAFCHEASHAQ